MAWRGVVCGRATPSALAVVLGFSVRTLPRLQLISAAPGFSWGRARRSSVLLARAPVGPRAGFGSGDMLGPWAVSGGSIWFDSPFDYLGRLQHQKLVDRRHISAETTPARKARKARQARTRRGSRHNLVGVGGCLTAVRTHQVRSTRLVYVTACRWYLGCAQRPQRCGLSDRPKPLLCCPGAIRMATGVTKPLLDSSDDSMVRRSDLLQHPACTIPHRRPCPTLSWLQPAVAPASPLAGTPSLPPGR